MKNIFGQNDYTKKVNECVAYFNDNGGEFSKSQKKSFVDSLLDCMCIRNKIEKNIIIEGELEFSKEMHKNYKKNVKAMLDFLTLDE